MDDTISRQAAKDVIANMEAVGYSPYATIGRLDALLALNRLPSAERRGKWKTLKGYPNILLCSECDTPYEKKEFAITPNYCYNCGARMVNEDE